MKELTPSSFGSNKIIFCRRLVHFLHIFYYYVRHGDEKMVEKKHEERQREMCKGEKEEVYIDPILFHFN